ncbi:MAG: thiamine pyrophosphate-binding protein [Haloferacaceae archaeon]
MSDNDSDVSGDDSGAPRSREYQDVDISGQEWGSDYIADLLKAYGFEQVSFNPGASFRGIEESIVNYNDNDPTVIETPHEGLSVSIAHGHAKATGDPALCILHDVVGTLHGAMSLYNAYADHVPVVALSGTGPMRKSERRPWIDWIHTALNQGEMVREYTKWDDQPAHIDGAAESLARAHRIADTKPKGPTYVTFDHDLQEGELDEPMEIPDLEKLDAPTSMAPDPDAVERAADMLLAAELPVFLVDQVGDDESTVEALVELAEQLGAAVIDPRKRRFNFPNTHPMDLSGSEIYREADLIVGLDVWSFNYTLTDTDRVEHVNTDAIGEDTQLIDVGTHELGVSSLVADYYDKRETDLAILADTALAVPQLRDAVAERLEDDTDAQRRAEERFDELAAEHDELREEWAQQAEDASDETPISVPRLASEVWDLIEDERWVLVNGTLRGWPHRLWEIDEYDSYIGGTSGGGGVGYGIGAAIGGALAYQDSDRVPINLQADGDLMFYPNALWTMGHYETPMLNVIHNNQSLYNSTEHRMRLANYRGRDDSYESALIGTGFWEPTPDYASMAESVGVNGYGPIEDPDEIAPALQAAWEDVQNGEPALVDVVCQPR